MTVTFSLYAPCEGLSVFIEGVWSQTGEPRSAGHLLHLLLLLLLLDRLLLLLDKVLLLEDDRPVLGLHHGGGGQRGGRISVQGGGAARCLQELTIEDD